MGSVGKFLKKSLNFTKDAYTGGFIKDAFGGGGDPGQAQAAEVRSLYGQGGKALSQASAQQNAAIQRGINTIPKAYEKARGAAKSGLAVSSQNAVDRGAQQSAQAGQTLASRGLYNSTVLDNARQGISSDVTRTLSDIQQSYDSLLAQYDIGEGQALQQGQMALAGAYGQQGAQQAQYLGQQAQTLSQIQYEDPNAWLNSLLGIGGTIAGTYIGKNL